ncbi:hypothetical protein MBLNU457_7470t1 [Dothideomycetes sp. NU457]
MVLSLFKLCRRTAIRNIDSIDDLGDEMPFEMLEPILRKVTSPEQLKTLEENSPQIAGLCGEMWQALIKRDIPRWETKIIEPKNPKSWWKVYRKLKREDEMDKKAAEEQLKQAMKARMVDKDRKQATIVHAVMPEGNKAAKAHFAGNRSMAFGGSAMSRKPTGAEALSLIRRQTFNANNNRKVTNSVPSQELANKRSQITRAPPSMVQAYARKAGVNPVQQPIPRIPQTSSSRPVIFAPSNRSSLRDTALNAAIRKENEAKEARLRALTSGKSRPTTSHQPTVSNAQKPDSTVHADRIASPATSSSVAQKKRPASGIFMSNNKKIKR